MRTSLVVLAAVVTFACGSDSQTVASKRARASWQKRQDPAERKRAADRAYQARKRAAKQGVK